MKLSWFRKKEIPNVPIHPHKPHRDKHRDINQKFWALFETHRFYDFKISELFDKIKYKLEKLERGESSLDKSTELRIELVSMKKDRRMKFDELEKKTKDKIGKLESKIGKTKWTSISTNIEKSYPDVENKLIELNKEYKRNLTKFHTKVSRRIKIEPTKKVVKKEKIIRKNEVYERAVRLGEGVYIE